MGTTLISRNSADRQAGSTTIAASLVKGLLLNGVDAIYIAPTQEQAHWAFKFHGVPIEAVMGWNPHRFLMWRRFRTVVLDGVARFDWSEGDPVEIVKRTQMMFSEPCQIVSFDQGPTMTDHELLEQAAKAAGGPVGRYIEPHGIMTGSTPNGPICWNPLHDDGDALRLAVKLDLNIFLSEDGFATVGRAGIQGFREDMWGDPCATTRRAITRAAAEIGKAMP